MIIDDEVPFCNLLATMIENHGNYVIKKYSNSKKALSEITDFKPDAVFVDMLMPGNDGGTVIKSIKELLSPTPLTVMVTGMVTEDEISGSSSPILAKPLNINSLIRILEEL